MEETSQATLYPYSERNGVGVETDVAALLGEPEFVLSEPERLEVQTYAHGLFDGRVDQLVCAAAPREGADGQPRPTTLRDIYRTSVTGSEQTFYLRYFDTEAGKKDLMAIDPEGDHAALTSKLLDVAYMQEHLSAKARKEIATRGLNWRKADLAARLAADETQDADYTPEETVTVNYEPEKLLDKLDNLQAYRRFYRAAHRELKEQPGTPIQVREAKQTLLDLHVARVNSMFAELVPHAANLAYQLDQSTPSAKTEAWADRLAAAVPVVVAAFRTDVQNREAHIEAFLDGYARRLDLVLQGAAWKSGEPNASPLSAELLRLAADLSHQAPENPIQPQVSREVVDVLDDVRWQAPQMKIFGEKVLTTWGELSEHAATWDEVDDRSGWAADGKWQVVVHPKRKSLSINGEKGVVIVPEDFDRGLLDESPAGALPVMAHELTHVWQTKYDQLLAKQVPLAEIKGRCYVTMREMGGIEQERVIHDKVGRTRGVNLHYLHALDQKLQGGNKVQAARAFYDSSREGKQLDPRADQDHRNRAADRTLRLYRHGGHNSQPLDYVEQELILRGISHLPEAQRTAIIIAGGSFSMRDSAALHRVGLLELPRSIDVSPAEDVWRIFMDEEWPAINGAAKADNSERIAIQP